MFAWKLMFLCINMFAPLTYAVRCAVLSHVTNYSEPKLFHDCLRHAATVDEAMPLGSIAGIATHILIEFGVSFGFEEKDISLKNVVFRDPLTLAQVKAISHCNAAQEEANNFIVDDDESADSDGELSDVVELSFGGPMSLATSKGGGGLGKLARFANKTLTVQKKKTILEDFSEEDSEDCLDDEENGGVEEGAKITFHRKMEAPVLSQNNKQRPQPSAAATSPATSKLGKPKVVQASVQGQRIRNNDGDDDDDGDGEDDGDYVVSPMSLVMKPPLR